MIMNAGIVRYDHYKSDHMSGHRTFHVLDALEASPARTRRIALLRAAIRTLTVIVARHLIIVVKDLLRYTGALARLQPKRG
jgi:hypothetical protein